jgi:hypothetical protein
MLRLETIQWFLVVYILTLALNGTIIVEMEKGLKRSWPGRHYPAIYIEGLRKIIKPIRIADVLAKIRTEHFKNRSVEHCSSTRQVGTQRT